MDTTVTTRELRYEIPSRTLAGTAPELLAELDDMIESLQMIRQFVLQAAPKPARTPPEHGLLRYLPWPFGHHAG